jgi:hypothetical protein
MGSDDERPVAWEIRRAAMRTDKDRPNTDRDLLLKLCKTFPATFPATSL